MHQLLPDDLSLLEPILSEPPANEPLLRAYLSGRVPGTALVDALPSPGACVVAVNYRFAFFGGRPSRAFQESAVRRLRSQQAFDLVWPAGPAKLPKGSAPNEVVGRLEFRRRQNRGPTHLDTLAAGAPQAEVRRIDSRMIRRCLWRHDVLRATGSTSEFLGHGLGFCLMLEEEIVAESYAVIWSGERAEIATVTNPAHRRRGYATVLCASLIKACESVGLSTYWNCDTDNAASVRLAKRLGFDDVHAYRLLRFPREAPAARRARKPETSFGGFARRLFTRRRARR